MSCAVLCSRSSVHRSGDGDVAEASRFRRVPKCCARWCQRHPETLVERTTPFASLRGISKWSKFLRRLEPAVSLRRSGTVRLPFAKVGRSAARYGHDLSTLFEMSCYSSLYSRMFAVGNCFRLSCMRRLQRPRYSNIILFNAMFGSLTPSGCAATLLVVPVACKLNAAVLSVKVLNHPS